jgi:3-carboxy-cis,cis-muconate cycloisomerase
MISPFEHPFLSGLLGDDEMAAALSVEAEVAALLRFEVALAEAEAELGVVPGEAGRAVAAGLAGFRPDLGRLRVATARDGVVVPELVRQLREAVGEAFGQYVHFGATSQDAIDTALALRLTTCLAVLRARLERLLDLLEAIAGRFGSRRLTGRTRMQAALPITVGDRIDSWRAPLARQLRRLDEVCEAVLVIQLGGAAGTLDKLGETAPSVRAGLARRLGLRDCPQWQSQRDRVVVLADWLSRLTGSLGKVGQDVALMAQAGDEIVLEGGGGSSAMPHKQNPIAAEVLVSLARYNAVQVAGMHQALVHEQERSGAAWTLEWLVLPTMLMTAGAATRLALELLGGVADMGRRDGSE